MLSIEQLTILSYVDDGVYCRKCGEDAGLPYSKAVCAYETYNFAGNEGLTCDTCGTEIVEPYEWACPHCDTAYSGDEAMDAENEAYRDEHSKCCEECPGDEESEDED